MNLARELLAAAENDPDRTALVPVGPRRPPAGKLTYGDLEERSAALAAQLRGLGVEPGERVLVQVDKSPEAVLLYLALLRSGAVLVPLNPAYTAKEVEYFVGDAHPCLCVVSPSTAATAWTLLEEETRPWAVLMEKEAEKGAEKGAQGEAADGLPRLDPWVEATPSGDLAVRTEPRRPSDPAALLYTSGTTGAPKGAQLAHGHLLANGRALCDLWQIEEGDVLLHVLPLFHVHGLFVALDTVLMAGGEVHLADSFDAAHTVDELSRATVFMGVPTHYLRLLREESLTRDLCDGMRLFTSGSAPLDRATFERFEERTGHRILERYGMTETGMIASNPYRRDSQRRDPHREEGPEGGGLPAGERVPGTVGFPLPETEVRVVDASGRCCPPDEVGVLQVRGPAVFAGYRGRPEQTREAFTEDGWFVTGDLGLLDAEGRITLVGRHNDLVIVGGMNVYPPEVEDVLRSVPGVAEAAVVGAPHPDVGEGLVAFLVAADEPVAEGEIQPVLDHALARFKHPRRFHWVEELPRNAMGKVQKAVLRERCRGAFGGS